MRTGSRTSRGLGALLAGATLAGAAAVSLAGPASAATGGVLVYGLTEANQIVQFRAQTPGTILATSPAITGLTAGDDVVGIDIRPANGVLYAVINGATADRVISVNPSTGATLGSVSLNNQLAGAAFAVDFNPVADRLRVISNTGQNLRINVADGVTTVDTPLNRTGTTFDVRGAAYTNNTGGATTTELVDYSIDGPFGLDELLTQNPPNAGTLVTRAPVTGANVPASATATIGFDIEAGTGTGYAVLSPALGGGREGLYTINTTTGVATLVGAFSTASPVEDLTVASPRLFVGDAAANEGQSAAVTVTRTGDLADTATAVLTPAPGSATAGDFDPATRTVTFAPGATTATAQFPLTTDTTTEPAETFTVSITSTTTSNGGSTTANRVGTVTILDGQARNVAGRFHPVTPTRVFDSRSSGGTINAGSDRNVQISGLAGVPATATAVVLNVTNTLATARGDLQVYPTGQRPASRTSNLNFFAGETVPVQVQTGLGTGGQITVSVNTGRTNVIVDVFGWYGDASDTLAGSSGYTALTPSRLLDTRSTRLPVVAGSDLQFTVGGKGGVPATATAVILNTTVLGTPRNADLQVYPTGAKPSVRTSNVNVRRGQTKANAVTVALGNGGSIGLSVSQNSAQVVLDVLGYYSVESRGRFVPLTPARILDTRGNGSSTTSQPLRAGQDRNIQVSSQGGVPGGAAAAVLSVTGTGASNPVDLQLFPTGSRPSTRTSTVNFRPGEAVANLAVATLGDSGRITLSLSQGSAAVVLDAVGYILND